MVDVVVVGGGPAGAAAAIELGRSGLDVLLVDKATFPRDKFCGDGLTAGALRLLESLGLDPSAVPSWCPVEDVYVASPSGHQVCFPLPRGQGTYAVVARRQELDAAVLNLARASGAKVLDGHAVTGVHELADRVIVTVAGVGEIEARYLVAADGMWSPVRKYLHLDTPGYRGEWHAFRQYFTDVGPDAARNLYCWFDADLLPGYAWSFPLPGNRANVGFGIQRGAKVAVGDMKQLWPDILERPHIRAVLGPDARPESSHRAWPIPARIDEVTLAGARTLFVGDAAAATDPMSGEGIGQALLTGVLAAEAILAGGPEHAEVVTSKYVAEARAHLVADHRMSMLLVRALKHRKGARAAVWVAGLTPWTRRNFARWLFEDYPRAIVVTPGRWPEHSLRGDGPF